jgi:HAMP domain-containing protein
MKIKNLGISKKINIIFFISIQVVSLAVGLIFYSRYTDSLMDGATSNLTNGIYATEILLSGEDLQALTKNSNEADEYRIQWRKLRKVQEKFGLTYLYILVRNPSGSFYYTYESGDDPEVIAKKNSDDSYSFTYAEDIDLDLKTEPPNQPAGLDTFFEIYDDAPSGVKQAYETEKLVTEEYKDKHGNFKSAFLPYYANGKKIGVIAADYNITHIESLKQNAIVTLLAILTIGLALTFVVRALINKIIIKPILLLNRGSKEISEGNLNFHIELKQKDEIGELANSFNTMAENLSESFNKIKEYNDLLEEKVEQRTKELQNTLEKVQELKVQQDGDYFLTSLLSDPLMQNRSKSNLISIDTFIEQKKKFNFRNKQKHLGGDLCIIGDLNFNGKIFIMFFNGDAMGKSMQGAGGALVMGSIVNSIMARSASNRKILTIEPRQWISEAFYEIQRVMESFDGAMFVSCILGLIEEQTGKMTYFNAEHPFSILYRDNKADFIETDISAHKIGTPNNHLEIYEFQFHPSDIFFCGSDGKDDLVLSFNEATGDRVINEDETVILRCIEEGKGVLDDIVKSIKKIGEISDDLSILRIEFLNSEFKESIETIPIDKNELTIQKLNIQVADLIKSKNYAEALELLDQIPDDSFAKDYYMGLCYSRMGNLKESAIYLEEANRKASNQKQILRQMSFVYFDLNQYEEAYSYLEKFLLLEPEDSKAKALMSILEDKLNMRDVAGF